MCSMYRMSSKDRQARERQAYAYLHGLLTYREPTKVRKFVKVIARSMRQDQGSTWSVIDDIAQLVMEHTIQGVKVQIQFILGGDTKLNADGLGIHIWRAEKLKLTEAARSLVRRRDKPRVKDIITKLEAEWVNHEQST